MLSCCHREAADGPPLPVSDVPCYQRDYRGCYPARFCGREGVCLSWAALSTTVVRMGYDCEHVLGNNACLSAAKKRGALAYAVTLVVTIPLLLLFLSLEFALFGALSMVLLPLALPVDLLISLVWFFSCCYCNAPRHECVPCQRRTSASHCSSNTSLRTPGKWERVRSWWCSCAECDDCDPDADTDLEMQGVGGMGSLQVALHERAGPPSEIMDQAERPGAGVGSSRRPKSASEQRTKHKKKRRDKHVSDHGSKSSRSSGGLPSVTEQSLICAACGTDNPADGYTRFCRGCSRSIQAQIEASQQAAASAQPGEGKEEEEAEGEHKV